MKNLDTTLENFLKDYPIGDKILAVGTGYVDERMGIHVYCTSRQQRQIEMYQHWPVQWHVIETPFPAM